MARLDCSTAPRREKMYCSEKTRACMWHTPGAAAAEAPRLALGGRGGQVAAGQGCVAPQRRQQLCSHLRRERVLSSTYRAGVVHR